MNYLDFVPEDVAYLIFFELDDHNSVYNSLIRYDSFKKVITNGFTYFRKIREKYPNIKLDETLINAFRSNTLRDDYWMVTSYFKNYKLFNRAILEILKLKNMQAIEVNIKKYDLERKLKKLDKTIFIEYDYNEIGIYFENNKYYLITVGSYIRRQEIDVNLAINLYISILLGDKI